MASYKTKLQEYSQKRHLPLPVYECVNDGPPHLPSFKCSVTVDKLRFESPAAYSHKKDAEGSAAHVAIYELATKHPEYEFAVTLGKTLLTELLAKTGKGSPTFSVRKNGVAHSPEFVAEVEIDGVSYSGGVAKNRKDAEAKASFAAFKAINEQVGGPFLGLEPPSENRVSQELKLLPEVCKNVKSGLTTTNSSSTSKFLVGTNSKQAKNSSQMVIMTKEDAVEKGPGISNASDENPAPPLKPDYQLQQETILIQPGQEEIEMKNEGVQEADLNDSVNKRSRSESEKHEQMNGTNKKIKNEDNPGMISSSTSMGN